MKKNKETEKKHGVFNHEFIGIHLIVKLKGLGPLLPKAFFFVRCKLYQYICLILLENV